MFCKISFSDKKLKQKSDIIQAKEQEKKINSKVYRGTVVVSGNAKVIVNNIGNNTFYGKLALEIQEKSGPSPLKRRLTELAKTISKIGYIGAVLVMVSYLFSEIVIDNSFNGTVFGTNWFTKLKNVNDFMKKLSNIDTIIEARILSPLNLIRLN